MTNGAPKSKVLTFGSWQGKYIILLSPKTSPSVALLNAKQQKCQADTPLPYSDEVKNTWSCSCGIYL
jgi:hypothetical protein